MRSKTSRKRKHNRAFTLVELLVVLGIIAVLGSLILPRMTRVQMESRQTQCANNLRQLSLAQLAYGSDNRENLPLVFGGSWVWDVPPSVTDAFGRYGATRQQFYCPAYPEHNLDALWNFAIAGFPPYRVTGYALTLQGMPSLITSNANRSITPPQAIVGIIPFTPQPAAARVLVADANLSSSGQTTTSNKLTYVYTDVVGGSQIPHHAAHMDILGRYPSGANVAMLDGHVEWRSFSNAICRTQGGVPGFWW